MMPKADVVEKARFDGEPSPLPRMSVAAPLGRASMFAWVRSLSDTRLALLVSATLLVLSAWPLLLVEVPPFQDLPNHLASVTVIQHPERYPEFVSKISFQQSAREGTSAEVCSLANTSQSYQGT